MEPNVPSWNTSASDPTNQGQSRKYHKLRRSSSSSSLIGTHPSTLFGENPPHVSEKISNILDHETYPVRRSHSLEHIANNVGASFRTLFSFSSGYCFSVNEDEENEIVSEAGDNGNRALSSRGSQRGSSHSIRNGVVFNKEQHLNACGFGKYDSSNSPKNCLISPLIEDVMTSLPIGALLQKELEEKKEQPLLEYVSCLVHLAVFGIFGVFSRYLLQKLFGPNVLGVTKDQEILYLDLPSNVVGSFLMGWLGVVFKADISFISDQLAIGLSTGYLGSLTTFSSWNQKMVELSVKGRWASAISGVIIGLFLCAYSINLGVETAKGFKKWLEETKTRSTTRSTQRSKRQQLIILLFMSLVWASLLGTSGVLVHEKLENGGSGAQLWLGCLVAPLGVWIRWWLATLNGRGIGKRGRYKWIPFGTLTANVLAASLMAALATLKIAVNTKKCDTIASGVQFGLLGCLSTVSTFMAEFNAMRNSSLSRRAHAYATITFGMSFVFSTLIFSIPVWTQGYE